MITKIKNGIIFKRILLNKRCKVQKGMFWHKDTEMWDGHTGTVVGEVFDAPTHLTGGCHRYLFVSDENPGMVFPINAYDVVFEDV